MKRIVLFMTLALFFTTALLLACGDQKEAQKPETAVTSADVKKEATEAMETAKAYKQRIAMQATKSSNKMVLFA